MDTKTIKIVIVAIVVSVGISTAISFRTRPSPSADEDLAGRVSELNNHTNLKFVDLEKSIGQLADDQEAIKKGTVNLFTDTESALEVGGIMEKDHKTPVFHWWCWFGRCERTEARCKASVSMAAGQLAERNSIEAANKLTSAECGPSRIAYCDARECFPTLKICEDIAQDSYACRGYE